MNKHQELRERVYSMAAVPLRQRTRYANFTDERRQILIHEAADRMQPDADKTARSAVSFKRYIYGMGLEFCHHVIMTL